MFTIVRLQLGAAIAATVLAMAAAAGAATVNLDYDTYSRGRLERAQADMAAFRAGTTDRHVEGFGSYKPWGTGKGTQNLRHTKVGSFTPFGRTGTGDAVVGDGSKLQVRNDAGMRWGRYHTGGGGGERAGNWLDSNDNRGVKWQIKGVGKFDSIGFFVTDVADVGGKFSLKVGKTLYSDIAGADGKLRNGNVHFVRILLDEAVSKLTVRFMHDVSDDGFGIGGVVVGSAAPVPVPPAAALLLTGLLGFFGLRRRADKKQAA